MTNTSRFALPFLASLALATSVPAGLSGKTPLLKQAVTNILPTDSNVVNGLSPLNWVRKSGFIGATICGASLKVGFTGTRQVVLNLDTRVITTTVAARYPIIAWSVNGGAFRTHQLFQGETSVVLDSNVSDPVIDLYCKGFSPFENRWSGDAPANSVKITGFTVDSGGKTAPVVFPAKLWMNIGNSIESGDAALYASGQGRPPDDVWAASDDGRACYGYLLATHYNYREIRLAYGGYNWGGSPGWFPPLTSLADSITSTVSRLTGNTYKPIPDIVLINLGENGVPADTSVVKSLIKVRTRVNAATKIIVMIPVSGKARTEVTRAFNTYKSSSADTSVYLIDLGTITFATADGQHPTAQGHQSIYAAALPAFNKIIPPTVGILGPRWGKRIVSGGAAKVYLPSGRRVPKNRVGVSMAE